MSAPCCGAGSLIPTLITGDDRAQVSLTLSHDAIVADAPVSGPAQLRAADDLERMQVARVQGAYLPFEHWQVGIDLPVHRRDRQIGQVEESASGLGDLALNVGFEWLPEGTYSAWRPRGFVFVKTVFPTGKSLFESTSAVQANAFGKGFYSFSAGLVFLKAIRAFDFALSTEGHLSAPRTFESRAGATKIYPGPGWSALLAAGFSPWNGPVRVGLAVSPSFESGRSAEGAIAGNTASQLVWNLSAQLGYQIASTWSTSLTYNDQTLLGFAHNVTLSRSLSWLLQRRFEL